MLRRRILVSLLAATAMASAAQAADLPSRAPAPVFVAPPAFTWTGFYIGVNAGGSFSNSNHSSYSYVDPNECGNAACTIGSTTNFRGGNGQTSGFIGGGQIGYNWQTSSLVFGLEADFDFANRNKQNGFFARTNCENFGGPPCNSGQFDHFLSSSRSGGDFGTFRGRLGFAMDRTLLYVTGGLAWGDNSNNTTVTDYRLQTVATQLASYAGVKSDTFLSNGNNGTSVGFAVGAGLEYALSQNWSVKAEYLYVSLDGGGSQRLREGAGTDFCTGTPGCIGTLTSNNRRDSFSTARIGLNYKFGG